MKVDVDGVAGAQSPPPALGLPGAKHYVRNGPDVKGAPAAVLGPGRAPLTSQLGTSACRGVTLNLP